jgi:AmiR/NasT family two-component response regulator
MLSTDGRNDGRRRAHRDSGAAGSLLQIALPKGTPLEAEVAVRRLIELVGTLAERAAQLQEALESRIVIEQAKGVLVERFEVSPDEAFTLLRRAARSNRMLLRELAAEVVASRETPPQFERLMTRRVRLTLPAPPAAR